MTPARAATHEMRRVATLTVERETGPRSAHDEDHQRGDREGAQTDRDGESQRAAAQVRPIAHCFDSFDRFRKLWRSCAIRRKLWKNGISGES